jgi:cytidine deaminase
MKINQKLYNAALELLQSCYKKNKLAGAVAMYTKEGKILTSTFPFGKNVHQRLCYETGSICEAHKYNYQITSSICLIRKTDSNKILVVAPCGVCIERLRYWGPDVQVAVPDSTNPTKWISKTLKEVQPYYWANILS